MRGPRSTRSPAPGWADGIAARRRRRARRLPLRRGDGAARGDRRPPAVPRIAPPFRHGADEVGRGARRRRPTCPWPGRGDRRRRRRRSSTTSRRWPTCPGIVAEGPDWFRSVGTAESPGTVVCTVTGAPAATASARCRWARRSRGHRRRSAAGARGRRLVGRDVRASPTPLLPADAARHAAHLRGHGGGRQRARLRPASSCSTTPTTWSPSPPAWPGSSPSSRAASARRASRTASPSPSARSSGRAATQRRRRLDARRRATTS